VKWVGRVVVVIAILLGGLGGIAYLTALRTEHPVGFEVVRASVAGGRPVAVGVWYPTEARPRPTTLLGPLLLDVAPDGPLSGRGLPLVVISHGNGGGPGSHADLAMALADARIKAAAVAAPGLGFTLSPNGLAQVRVPVQLWSGDLDTNVPYATNARLVRDALGSLVEFHPVAGASHFSFLAPCGLLKPTGLCSDPGQFDRKAFHAAMNADVVAFFDRNMPAR